MSLDLQSLTDPNILKQQCQTLTVEQLQKTHGQLCELIDERRACRQEQELKRKGDRVLGDMRGLMAKAGVSMSELQNALSRL